MAPVRKLFNYFKLFNVITPTVNWIFSKPLIIVFINQGPDERRRRRRRRRRGRRVRKDGGGVERRNGGGGVGR